MNSIPHPRSPWRQLQAELRDLAFLLDRKSSPIAADLAVTIAVRIEELLTAESLQHEAGLPASPEPQNASS